MYPRAVLHPAPARPARVDRRFAYADARLENRGEKYLPWGDLVHLHLALDVRAPIFELVIIKEF